MLALPWLFEVDSHVGRFCLQLCLSKFSCITQHSRAPYRFNAQLETCCIIFSPLHFRISGGFFLVHDKSSDGVIPVLVLAFLPPQYIFFLVTQLSLHVLHHSNCYLTCLELTVYRKGSCRSLNRGTATWGSRVMHCRTKTNYIQLIDKQLKLQHSARLLTTLPMMLQQSV